jgi:hypothetical protein
LGKLGGLVWCNVLLNVVKNERILDAWKKIFTQNDIRQLELFIKNNRLTSVKGITIELLRRKKIKSLIKSLKNVIFECPSISVFILWSLLVELHKMFMQKFFSKYVKY